MIHMIQKAIDKLNTENKKIKGKTIEDKMMEVMRIRTCYALIQFCKMEEEFAQAVVQSDKTFSDCLRAISKDMSNENGSSDVKVFQKAVQFYFPGATVENILRINLAGAAEAPNITMTSGGKKSVLEMSLDDLF